MRKIKAKAKISVVVSIALLISFLSIFLFPKSVKSQESYTEITDCTTITSPGEYRLVSDIIDADVSVCIDIQSDNVILDCQGHILDQVYPPSDWYGVGVNIDSRSNVTIKNCVFGDWVYYGVYSYQSSNVVILNSSFTFGSEFDVGVSIALERADNCYIDNITSYRALDIMVSTGCYLNNLYLSGVYAGIYILSSSGITMENIKMMGTRPINIVNSDHINLTNAYIGSFYYGIDLAVVEFSSFNNIEIYGMDSADTGIYIFSSNYNNFTNITINNFNYEGIWLGRWSSGNTFINVSISDIVEGYGLLIYRESNGNYFKGLTIRNTSNAGIFLYFSAYNVFEDFTISDIFGDGISLSWLYDINEFRNGLIERIYPYLEGGGNGIRLASAANQVFHGIIIRDVYNCGIYLWSFVHIPSENNLFYNNIFMNRNNTCFEGLIYSNYWNTTLQPGTNIWNSSLGYIGGNLWTTPDNTGYSDICVDADYDGFCDEPYDLLGDGSNIDYLPLAKYVGQNAPASQAYTEITGCTIITEPGEYRLVNDLQLGTYPYCLDIFSNDVIIDCQGYKIQDYTGYHSHPDGINIRQNVANVVVKNCDIRGFAGEAGIFLRGSNSMIRIYNTSIADSKIGVIGDGSGIILDNISTNNVQNPLWLDSVSNLKVLNSKISATSNLRINGTDVEIANNEFRYVNVIVNGDLFLTNSSVYGNTIYAINDNYDGPVLVNFLLGGRNIDVYDNILYSTNTSYVASSNRSLVIVFVRYEAYNVSFYDNVGYAKFPNGVLIGGVSVFSPNAENIYTYNNYIESTGLLCIQSTNGNNQYIYNNTILDGCIWVIGPVINSYIYDNMFSLFIVLSTPGPINNVYAYNNTIWANYTIDPNVKILYIDLDFGNRLIGSNIFHPETYTLTPYLSLVLNYTSINYGTTIPFNSYDYVGGIAIDTNMIDYKIEIDSTDLVSGANSISKNNLSFGFNKTLDFSYLISPYGTISILKQNLYDALNILTRLFVPLVPPGSYTGTVTITVSQGLSDNQIPNPHGGVNVEMV